MHFGIIGGGIMGLTLGYYLSQEGYRVSLLERGGKLGGLAGSLDFDGCTIDKYYHSILGGDTHLLHLIDELGISGSLRFKGLRMGFYHEKRFYPMSTPRELMTFPPLNMLDRFRLVGTVLYSLAIRDWHKLEDISVEKWLTGVSGRNNYQNIWKPLLRAKFDGNFGDIPATYIWSRILRMNSIRHADKTQGDNGYLTGGFYTLINSLAGHIRDQEGEILLNTAVERLEPEGNKIRLKTGERTHVFDKVISTVPTPYFRNLLPQTLGWYKEKLAQIDYLDIVCLLMVLKKSLGPFHTLNITDGSLPFTGVIETTHLIDPMYVNGNSLVYFPIYLAPGSEIFKMPESGVFQYCLPHIKEMFPDFREKDIVKTFVMRSRFVEPIHRVRRTGDIPDIITPVSNLFLANTTQVYPEILNCESVVRFSKKVVEKIKS